jgi:hypothetical protein
MTVEFNPDVDRHQELASVILDILPDEGWVSTPDLLENTIDELPPEWDWSKSYLRGLLGEARQYLEQQGDIETKTERRGGRPTIYWQNSAR